MTQQYPIPPIKRGDLIYITAPAKSIDNESIQRAVNLFESRGYQVLVSEHCTGEHNYFSGTDEERMLDLQCGIDHPEVKAIVCARGGYGCVRIIDLIGWAGMLRNPKWMVGFSDVTVFHSRLQNYGLESIHATMPLNFIDNSQESFDTLFDALEGKAYSITAEKNKYNKPGEIKGKLVGGNLSIIYSLLGTDDRLQFTDNILFIEDLCEYLYHIDRMMSALRKSGALEQISGLIVGGMTEMNDTAVPFGMTVEEIILDHLKFRNIPVSFGLPAGHINDNRALLLGSEAHLIVDAGGSRISFRS
jgi:muramoyltetrapeptide carboxypeptidase